MFSRIITNVRRTSLPISILAVPHTGQSGSFSGIRCSTTSTGTLSGRTSSGLEERRVWAATSVSLALRLDNQASVSSNMRLNWGLSVLLPAAPRTLRRVSSCSGALAPEASPISGSARLFPLSETHIPPVKWLPSPGCLSHDFFHFSWVNYTIFELESPVFPGFSAILPPK